MAETTTVRETDRELSEGRGLAEQWLGMLFAPAVFFAHLQVAYMLVPWACATGGHVWIHVAGVASVVLAAVGALFAWRAWDRVGRDAPGEAGHVTTSDGEREPVPRARLLGAVGLGMSAMFVLLLLAQWVAAFVISPCQ